jgi:hypothetical protein
MKKNNILKYFFIGILAIATSSCSKKGCTDSYSSNYDSKAKKDDGSCAGCTDPNSLNYNTNAQNDDGSCTYYTIAIIKSVTVTYPSMDGGYSWDDELTIDSLPDLHIVTTTLNWNTSEYDTIYKSDTTNNASSPHSFNCNLTILEDNFFKLIEIELYDFDPSASSGGFEYSNYMGGTYTTLDDYTANPSNLFPSYTGDPYPTSITETSFGGIEFTYSIEWKE